ncbi:MAG: 5-oxoprolinase subunit PxpA [Cyanothece sp. SIO1E1]|nr:5-oxoprolinase subunit PxpA [Cyanothece sp. SIO1E1]
MKSIDLNCDLGEWRDANGLQKDASIMPFISSCNIACGGHIGDEKSMRSTIRLALKHNVGIGAHPSYPDKDNFGRKVLEISSSKLKSSLIDQLSAFITIVEEEGGKLHHIKPHGALYNEVAINSDVAETVIEAILEISCRSRVYAQQGSMFDEVARASGVKLIYEVFADRAYEENLRLRSRALDGAIIHKKGDVLEHIHRMVIEGKVKTYSGVMLPIRAETLCLHSDTIGSIQLAMEIFEYLKSNGVEIATA